MISLRTLRENTHVYPSGLGEIGIEVETETREEYSAPELKYWYAHGDGSLRNFGVEYIFQRPLNFESEEYNYALKEFGKFASKKKFIDSTYTSVHVHLNMLDKPLIQLVNFITLYVIFEETLTRYCGPDRDGNLFCLKTSNAETNYRQYIDLCRSINTGDGENHIRRLNAAQIKYSGLNIAPLRTQGSVEVRTHGGTTDVKEINTWVGMLMRLYNQAAKYSSPIEIVSLFKDRKNNLRNVEQIFDYYAKYLDKKSLDKDLETTLYYAAAIGSSVKNWKEFVVLPKKPKELYKKVMTNYTEASLDTDNLGVHDLQWALERLAQYNRTREYLTTELTGDV